MWPRGLMYLAKSNFPLRTGQNKQAVNHLNFQLWPVVVDKCHIEAWGQPCLVPRSCLDFDVGSFPNVGIVFFGYLACLFVN